jgi:hypothetical protein
MTIKEDDFYEEYKPQTNHLDDNASFSGCMYETYGDELQYVFELVKKENRVWTIVEGDEGMCFTAGFHYVNRMGFLITEKPWNDEGDWVELDDDFCSDDELDEEPIDTIHNALTGYIEDCAGEGTPEAEAIELAWNRMKVPFCLDDKEKDNLMTIVNSLEPTSELHATLLKVITFIR